MVFNLRPLLLAIGMMVGLTERRARGFCWETCPRRDHLGIFGEFGMKSAAGWLYVRSRTGVQ